MPFNTILYFWSEVKIEVLVLEFGNVFFSYDRKVRSFVIYMFFLFEGSADKSKTTGCL